MDNNNSDAERNVVLEQLQEAISTISEIKEVEKEIATCQSDLDKLKSKSQERKTLKRIFWGVSYFLSAVVGFLVLVEDLGFFLGLALCGILHVVTKKGCGRKAEAHFEKHAQPLRTALEVNADVLRDLKAEPIFEGFIPEDYCDTEPLEELYKLIENRQADTVKGAIELYENIQQKTQFERGGTAGTHTGKAVVEFDDAMKKMRVPKGKSREFSTYDYSDIVNFELLEDEEKQVAGGCGRALGFALLGNLFGGIIGGLIGGIMGSPEMVGLMVILGTIGGIIYGGSYSSKPICRSLKIKVTINQMSDPTAYIEFINSNAGIAKSSEEYKAKHEQAQECVSKLQLICENRKKTSEPPQRNSTSGADEILKYKDLLDRGILTQDEFDQKKKQLLEL